MRDLLLWASSLATGPKIILSVVVVLIAAFILIVLWAPAPAPNATSIDKSPNREPADTDSPAPSSASTASHSEPRSSTPRGQYPEKALRPAPQSAAPSVSAGRVEGSVIISQGQVGGQIAHSITNVGPQPRRVSPEAQAHLAKILHAFSPCTYEIEVVAGDGEARDLAFQIQAALNAGGWNSTGFANSMFPRPIVGVIVSAPDETPPVEQFLEWARRAGLNPQLELLRDLKQVHVLVGARE